jgi:hypothetical protein
MEPAYAGEATNKSAEVAIAILANLFLDILPPNLDFVVVGNL